MNAFLYGTSSWSEKSWDGVFYPPHMPPGSYLEHYASQFDAVEADVTYYRVPDAKLVDGWAHKTPPGFTLCAKFPGSITHGGKEAAPVSSLHKCMACGSGLSRRPSKKKGQFWWGCSNFPTCKQTYPDLKGRPDYSKGRNGPASE